MKMRIFSVIAALSLSIGSARAADDEPKISKKQFPAPPLNLFYFDDSETVVVLDPEKQVIWRSEDAGGDWEKIDDVPGGKVVEIIPNLHDSSVAIAVGDKREHWITYNRGKSWKRFETPEDATATQEAFSFHADDNKRILFHGFEECWFDAPCLGKTYYTTNGFDDSDVTLVHGRRKTCLWARSNVLFSTGDKQTDANRIVCIVEGKFSKNREDFKLLVSDDYFKTEQEPSMAGGREVRGFMSMAAVKGFIVAAAKSFGSLELGLYVTTNGAQWHRAEFGDVRIEEDAYTVLESTNYSIQVDVMTQRHTYMGNLYTSNSNGTYFTKNVEHTNRNRFGIVDFEKIQNIQGIVLVNQVENWEEVDVPFNTARKELRSKISFDDGRTWESLKVGSDDLHIHSVSEQSNSGRVFSSAAPGIVMGVGNVGKRLGKYEEGELFVSDDAGRTWIATNLKGPQKYEFLDQGSVLVAVADRETDFISYSLDHGRTWKKADLPEKGIRPHELTTIPDSTSLRAILIATKGSNDYYSFTLDFDGLHERKCGDDDFEKWYARVDDDGKPSCVMGHKQYFMRRKKDAKCFVKQLTNEFLPEAEKCKCTDLDFECDTNFKRTHDGKCEVAGKLRIPDGQCKNRDDKFKASSGFRLIPGDNCERTDGAQKDDLMERPCSDAINAPASGKIDVKFNDFRGQMFRQTFYLERKSGGGGTDETIVMLTDQERAYITRDHGKTWNLVKDEEIVAIYPHQYNNDYVYFITRSKKVYYSKDRGDAIHSFDAPDVPNEKAQVLGFHQQNPDWLLWTGNKNCNGGRDDDCHTTAHVSTKSGSDWSTLLNSVEKCQFMYQEGRNASEKLIWCEQYEAEDTKKPLLLIASTDYFERSELLFNDIVNFATMSEFIVVAAKTEDHKWLKVDASIDGRTFAPAEFPPNFQVEHQQAYTVLDSSTNSIFLHVTVNGEEGREYGTILKSNSNGTSYVLSIRHINRNLYGFVDFEKMEGLEGVAIVNQVANAKAVDGGSPKQLKTLMTHNDGADWGYLQPPKTNFDGKPWGCENKDEGDCALHLHGYTERKDARDTYSSPSAVGVMLGVGNVGDRLGAYNEGDTFITTDGGISWKVAMKGTYMWEYGDQGSVIVLVERDNPTKTIFYTLNEGEKWEQFQFSESKMLVDRITTVPSDNSLNFLLWGTADRKLTTVNLDFSGLYDRQCDLDKNNLNSEKSDYYLWHPTHPLKSENPDCLFGHVAQYYRKKPDRLCSNGPLIDKLHDIERNCTCTREDFECAYNYERQADGSCRLVDGLSPADPQAICQNNNNVFEYWDITGYRKIPLSTCSGGKEMEHTGSRHPCPGKEEEFAKKNGISGVGLFFAIVIPFAAAAGIGYWVWQNWGNKFGAIRLGDTSSAGSFTEGPWVQWPVAAISGLVAVMAALPLLVGSLWRSARGMFGGYGGRTYTSRSSFARGRGDYAAVDHDADELLGDDSDEEV